MLLAKLPHPTPPCPTPLTHTSPSSALCTAPTANLPADLTPKSPGLILGELWVQCQRKTLECHRLMMRFRAQTSPCMQRQLAQQNKGPEGLANFCSFISSKSTRTKAQPHRCMSATRLCACQCWKQPMQDIFCLKAKSDSLVDKSLRHSLQVARFHCLSNIWFWLSDYDNKHLNSGWKCQ